MTSDAVLKCPDYVGLWIRLDRLSRYVVGRRLEEGSTAESDAALGRLIALHRWLERRLVN
jgi:hypothetical protein